jgi:HupE/UreJ protein
MASRSGLGARAVIAGLVWLGIAAVTHAHTGGSTGYAAITVAGSTVRYSLTLSPAALPEPIAATVVRARDGRPEARDDLLGLLREKITLTADGTRCGSGQGSLRPPGPAAESVTFVVDFACGRAFRELIVRDDTFDVLGADHHTLARLEAAGAVHQLAFEPSAREARVQIGPEHVAAEGGASFVLLGIEHILTGWDHLLFLLVLMLGGGGFLSLLKIVTAFTVAHSVTLTLAVLDVVVLPDRFVESVIALSIALVAAENLRGQSVIARRWVVSFAFGLVHGFGFAGTLRELALPRPQLALALFGFNAGVEIGQAAVVTCVLPLLLLLRRTGWERRVVVACSLMILVVGAALVVERAFLT